MAFKSKYIWIFLTGCWDPWDQTYQAVSFMYNGLTKSLTIYTGDSGYAPLGYLAGMFLVHSTVVSFCQDIVFWASVMSWAHW